MRCKGCGYELWSMAPGTCPECGRAWTFRDFRFRPGHVQFLCPACDHAYAGHGPEGHPVPESFDCRSCGSAVTLGSMRALPAPGIAPDEAMSDLHPWVDRSRIGRWRAFWRTVGLSMTRPRDLARCLPPSPSFRDGMVFAIVASTISMSLLLACFSFWTLPSVALAPGSAIASGEALLLASVMAGSMLLRPMIAVLQGWVAHGILAMTGAVAQHRRVTVAACMYGLGPAVVDAIPLLNCIVPAGTIWSLLSSVLQVSAAQRVSGVRATVAVLALPAALLAGAVAVAVLAGRS